MIRPGIGTVCLVPLLMKEAVVAMLAETTTCDECEATVHRNYCRNHDEFCTDGHETGCSAATHVGCRGYDENAPTVGDDHMSGWRYENEHGSYRIGGTRGPATKIEP